MSSNPFCVECEHCHANMEWALEQHSELDDIQCDECGAWHYISTCCHGEGDE